jgi:hypothetical protein
MAVAEHGIDSLCELASIAWFECQGCIGSLDNLCKTASFGND